MGLRAFPSLHILSLLLETDVLPPEANCFLDMLPVFENLVPAK